MGPSSFFTILFVTVYNAVSDAPIVIIGILVTKKNTFTKNRSPNLSNKLTNF